MLPSNDSSKEKHVSPAFDEDVEPLDHLSGSGTTLVRALSLALRPGMHLMITGSNGVGKTAVARILAGLWAPTGAGARVTRPTCDADTTNGRPRPGVFVVPQRAYMVTGSLLEQVIYPRTLGEFYALHGGDAEEGLKELQEILETAHLGYLVEREGGWGTVKEWRDVLSGGEKQRVRCLVVKWVDLVFFSDRDIVHLDGAFARILSSTQICHLGRYVAFTALALATLIASGIECTSAVSSDVEGQMYEHAKSLGISLITISLRYVWAILSLISPHDRQTCIDPL